MLVIRLARIGTKNKPTYRIIISEKGRDNYGKVLENLGTYNTFTKDLKLEEEKVKTWISKGAQLSATLNNLFITKGIIKGEKVKSRRMNTEKLVKARTDKVAADKKAVEDAKTAAAKVMADKAAEEDAAATKVKADAEAAKVAKESSSAKDTEDKVTEAAPPAVEVPAAETSVAAPVEEVK
jgi:small subunit ribosomal protein S16